MRAGGLRSGGSLGGSHLVGSGGGGAGCRGDVRNRRRTAALDPHRRADRAELPRSPVGHRHAHGPLRGAGLGRRGCAHLGHPQDHPGPAGLAKAAVRAGGGRNHRGNLSDWMLIKDNHLGGIAHRRRGRPRRDRWPGRTVHVECDTSKQCVEALEVGADAILLDNMTPERGARSAWDAQSASRVARRAARCWRCPVGSPSTRWRRTPRTGVDQISVGAITNSAPVLDIGLDLRLSSAAVGLLGRGDVIRSAASNC